MFPIADAGFGFLPTKFTPAQNFSRLAFTTDVDLMHTLGTSIIISRWPIEDQSLEEVAELGIHRVYRFTAPPAPPVDLKGPGTVRVVSWKAEERVVELSGTETGSTIVFAVSYYDKWRAVQGGRELKVSPASLGGVSLVAVSGASDGEVRLIYGDHLIEHLVSAASVIALVACFLGLGLKPRPLVWPWSAERARLLYKILGAVLASLLLGSAIAATVVGRAAEDGEWLSNEPTGSSIASVLHLQDPIRFSFKPEYSCVRPHTRDPAWGCTERDMDPRLAPGSIRAEKVPSCVSVGLPPGPAKAEIEFTLPSGSDLIKGRLSLKKGAVAPSCAIRFDSSGKTVPLGAITTRSNAFREPVPGRAKKVTFVISSKDLSSGAGHAGIRSPIQRVCIEAVAIKRP